MTPSDMSNDDIRTELSAIAVELTELPDDAFSRRVELRDRRSELRAEIGSRPIAASDVASMRREIAGLQRRMAEILEQRPNIAAMADGGEGQRGMAENQQLGWDYDAGTGRHGIHERIRFLERRIAEAGTEA
jgi:hypothetical protein